MTCDDVRLGLGSLVLGALDADEAARTREHLRTCEPCRAEYDELTDMPRLMGLVSVTEASTPAPVPTPKLRASLLQRVTAERSRQHRRRIAWTAVGGVAVAVVAAAIGFGVADVGTVAESPDAATQVLAATDAGSGVWAKVELDGVAWGTRLDLQLSGAEAGETCRLEAITADGERQVVSTWKVPSVAPERGYLSVPGATDLTPDLIHAFEVTTGDGRLLLRLDEGDEVEQSST